MDIGKQCQTVNLHKEIWLTRPYVYILLSHLCFTKEKYTQRKILFSVWVMSVGLESWIWWLIWVLGQWIKQARWRHLFRGQRVSWLCVPKCMLISLSLHVTSAHELSETRVSFYNLQLGGSSHLPYSLTSPSVKSCSALLYSFYRLWIVVGNPIFFISWFLECISVWPPPPPSHSNFKLKIHCLTCSQKGQLSERKFLSHKRTQWPTLWTV